MGLKIYKKEEEKVNKNEIDAGMEWASFSSVSLDRVIRCILCSGHFMRDDILLKEIRLDAHYDSEWNKHWK